MQDSPRAGGGETYRKKASLMRVLQWSPSIKAARYLILNNAFPAERAPEAVSNEVKKSLNGFRVLNCPNNYLKDNRFVDNLKQNENSTATRVVLPSTEWCRVAQLRHTPIHHCLMTFAWLITKIFEADISTKSWLSLPEVLWGASHLQSHGFLDWARNSGEMRRAYGLKTCPIFYQFCFDTSPEALTDPSHSSWTIEVIFFDSHRQSTHLQLTQFKWSEGCQALLQVDFAWLRFQQPNQSQWHDVGNRYPCYLADF